MRRTWWPVLIALLGLSIAGCAPTASVPPSPASATASATATGPAATPAPAGSPAGPSGSMALVARLAVTRAAHTATTLLDGRVLIAGGCIEDSCEGITATTELLDPATGASSAGPDMLQPRVGHAAVLLPDGRVLMIGGFQSGTVTASTEVFDPATTTFRAGPDLLEPLADPVALFLPDGMLLVAGGYSGHASLPSAELLDPGLTSFRSTGAMSTPRSAHGGALLPDGRVIVIGGNARGDTGTVLDSAEIYDQSTGSWTPAASMSVPRHKLAVVGLADGRVLAVGGSNEQDAFGQYRSAELYDPATGGFTATGDMAARRYKLSGAVVRLEDGRILLAAGSSTPELYDPTSGTFVRVAGDVDTGFNFSAAALLPDGTVLVSGGYDDGIHLTDQVLRFVA